MKVMAVAVPEEGEESGELLDWLLNQMFVVHHVQRRLGPQEAVQGQLRPHPYVRTHKSVECCLR